MFVFYHLCESSTIYGTYLKNHESETFPEGEFTEAKALEITEDGSNKFPIIQINVNIY